MDFEKIVRFLSNELSDKEKDDFLSDEESGNVTGREFEQVRKIWETSSALKKYKMLDTVADWATVSSRLKPRLKQRTRKLPLTTMLYRAAIIIIIAAGLAFGLHKVTSLMSGHESIVVTTDANSREVTLPDGSLITLNKNSALRYNNRFNKNNRELFFSGEAFFDVSKNASLPFVIRTGNTTIQVLGTSFNVKEDTCALKVTVVSGRVSVYETKNRKNQVQLIRNQTASFEYATKKIIYGENSDLNFLSWKTGRFEFFKTPTADVLSTLANYFDKKLILNINLKDSITGVFENQPLNEILKEIEMTTAIKIEHGQDYIIVRK
ncbi:MAG: FecR domain-containing protein [Bacteroidales bacterium]|nr:FecR domain-containing protein [Bacteroidales bacterium]